MNRRRLRRVGDVEPINEVLERSIGMLDEGSGGERVMIYEDCGLSFSNDLTGRNLNDLDATHHHTTVRLPPVTRPHSAPPPCGVRHPA